MLVASRDPFHGSHDVPAALSAGGRLARTMSLLQVLGTVLAIPVGVGSAYTMYKSNFTAEASCQSLRANIIQILDKSVDAGARHMLVRRDVEAFEKTCGGVDPDAAAAFKGLLAVDKIAVAAVPRRVEVQPKAVEVKPAEVKAAVDFKAPDARPSERKTETKIEAKTEAKPETKSEAAAKPVTAKPAAPLAAVAVLAVPPREAVKSDTEWLDAVRGALKAPPSDASAEGDEPKAEAKRVEGTSPEAKPVEAKPIEAKAIDTKPIDTKPAEAKNAIAAPLVRQAVREAPPMSIENVRTPPLMTVLAPTLPPPSAVASAPEPRNEPRGDARAEPRFENVRADNHPVPPGAIPDPPADVTPPEERSRIGQLISEIPFAKRLLDK